MFADCAIIVSAGLGLPTDEKILLIPKLGARFLTMSLLKPFEKQFSAADFMFLSSLNRAEQATTRLDFPLP